MRLLVLTPPGQARVDSLQAALAARHWPPAEMLSYIDVLQQPQLLRARLEQPCWLKLEAPGSHTATSDALIARGAAVLGQSTPPALQHGELAHVRLWFAGFESLLRDIEHELQLRPWVRCLNPPAAILAQCDKWRCQQRLIAHGVPTPTLLGEIADFAELRQILDEQAMTRVFVKPAYGSSASGVVALASDGRGHYQATTAIEHIQSTGSSTLYNSLRIHRYRDQQVATLIDALVPNRLYVEQWIPKPCAGSDCFDVRMVTLAGRPVHRVARLATQPLTNLHLGNRRGMVAELLSPAAEARMEMLAGQVAACFEHSMIAGIDMIATEQRMHVLEVNAFGDWLPNLLWQGRNIHECELDCLVEHAETLERA